MNGWTCGNCGRPNRERDASCILCRKPKKGNAAPAPRKARKPPKVRDAETVLAEMSRGEWNGRELPQMEREAAEA